VIEINNPVDESQLVEEEMSYP